MSTVKVSNVQFGNGSDAQNFSLKVPSIPNGTMSLVRGGADSAPVQTIFSIDTAGNMVLDNGQAVTKNWSVKDTSIATTAYVYNHRAVPRAWVVFRGLDGMILTQYNVSSVTRTGAGLYSIAMNTANMDGPFNSGDDYCVIGNCATDSVENTPPSFAPGNDNIVCTRTRYQTSFDIGTWDAASFTFEDPGVVFLVIMGV
jgi:hypothetical protein